MLLRLAKVKPGYARFGVAFKRGFGSDKLTKDEIIREVYAYKTCILMLQRISRKNEGEDLRDLQKLRDLAFDSQARPSLVNPLLGYTFQGIGFTLVPLNHINEGTFTGIWSNDLSERAVESMEKLMQEQIDDILRQMNEDEVEEAELRKVCCIIT
eukprot:TRINITY_DN2181_c0_g1_i3.p1 TRINITY_DN2181_c0_g1~~TRINITY_DN2181_c0_g1_i3.p1  ORF type:complete len:155 (-),score=25.96 TRINITY_DN2181_c0_g1_i3:234-698(-)